MKILIVSGIFPPDIGGPASYVPTIASEFTNRQHQVKVLTFSDTQKFEDDCLYNFKIIRILRREYILIREIKFVIKGIFLAKNCDIIYANGNNFKAYLIAKFCNIPVVHKIVGDTSWERAYNHGLTQQSIDEYQKKSHNLKIIFFNWVRTFPLSKSNLIITPSIYLAKIVKNWAPKNQIKVIYNAFHPNDEIYAQEYPDKKNTIVMVGRLVPWKGIEQSISALLELPHLSLMIIGDGPSKKELENHTAKLKLNNRVKFVGQKSRQEVYSLMKEAFCLLINSNYEGLPHVALEAFQVNLPVIATSVGGNPEVIIDGVTGLLIPASDKNSLVTALRRLREIDTNIVCQNAQKTLFENFSYQKMIQETEVALKEIALQ